MNILLGFLYVVEVIVCLLLGLVVMLQKPKEGGLGGLAGGMGEAVFGADAGNVLIKVTVWLGTIFLVTTLLIARIKPVVAANAGVGGDEPAAQQQQQQPGAPEGGAPAPAPAPETPAQ